MRMRVQPEAQMRDRAADADLVDIGAELLGGRHPGLDVVAPRIEVGQEHDGLAALHLAELELFAEHADELRGVQELRTHRFAPSQSMPHLTLPPLRQAQERVPPSPPHEAAERVG